MENSGCLAKIRVMLWAEAEVAKTRAITRTREMVCRSCIFPARVRGESGGGFVVGG